MRNIILALTVFTLTLSSRAAVTADNPFLGGWELTLPGGKAGWLGVELVKGEVKASMMWAVGSVEPTASALINGDQLLLTRNHVIEKTDPSGKKTKRTLVEMISATLRGDAMHLISVKPRENGEGEEKINFGGKRTPAMPPTPDLSSVKFGPEIQLFNGKDLTGWRLTDPAAINGWSAKDGLLVNTVVQSEGQHKNYGNLRTDREFEDFNLKLEVRLGEGQNSGVYLRGMYEVQVADTYGKPLDSHNMGALYSRIKPTISAEKPAGNWQSMDITFVQRHLTVILNGKTIIDNQPVLGCTGGALSSDVSLPGPLYLQGDHTGSEYRNIVLRPVVQ